MLDFGRELCNDLCFSGSREWLVTNGIGGYASGTVAGLLTRRYHGLLVAALDPPLGRTLLLAKLDETALYDGCAYPLFVNQWASGDVEPTGYHHLERFHLEGTTPVWTFACGDALLEKRVWMEQGANTTYVHYRLERATGPLILHIKAILNCRDHHTTTHGGDWSAGIDRLDHGLLVRAGEDALPLYLLSRGAEVEPCHEWYRGYYLQVENYRGLDDLDDNLCGGSFQATLHSGGSLTIVASTDANPNLDSASAHARRWAYEQQLLAGVSLGNAPPAVEHLVLASDQFIVRRSLPHDPDGRSVIAGYPWFGDWGRDTMISLPGLTLATGRYEVAARILTTFAHYAREGMLPNRFPDEGEEPEYNTVDATLWYFEAIRAYHAMTGNDDVLHHLFPTLEEIIDWHQRGTRYRIRVDPADGLLYAGEPGVQLTWMDAKVDDWVVTPRIGKPVEINALWHNALCIMASFARHLGRRADLYDGLAGRAASGFGRFWNADLGYCYDVIDGPEGDDPALRPNQLFAVSLIHSPLTAAQQRAVVDVCARHLLTPHGLRSLAPDDPAYVGHYGGDRRHRDAAYHQGTVWGWLMGPFVRAHLRVYQDPALARSFLWPLVRHVAGHGVGSISEIFDGDPPFAPRGCIAQAWSVAELLWTWQATGEGSQD
jgi:predicted glycogen debranching enzyme